MIDTKEIVNELNELLEKNYDAIKGYRHAAENVDSSQLKQFFAQQASERSQFGQEIQRLVSHFGGKPVEEGSFLGSIHRKWLDIKGALTSNDEEAIIEACVTGEKAALDDYQDFLNEDDIPADLKAVLADHQSKINQALVRLENLEEYYD